jgi:hypothetical protein
MKILISYRREDSEHITGRIYDRLAAHFGGGSLFMDIDTIPSVSTSGAISQTGSAIAMPYSW